MTTEKVEYDESKGLAQGWDGIEKKVAADKAAVSPGETTFGDLMEAATEFGKLKIEEKYLDNQLTILKGKIKQVEPTLLGFMEKGCVNTLKLDIGLTIYLHRQIWGGIAEGATKEQLVAQLKAHTASEFLIAENYNAQQLGAWVREFPRNDEGEPIIPDVLKGVLTTTEKVQARARKA